MVYWEHGEFRELAEDIIFAQGVRKLHRGALSEAKRERSSEALTTMVTLPDIYSGSDRTATFRCKFVSCSQGGALRPGSMSKTCWAAVASSIVLSCFISLVIATPEGDALVQVAQPWGVANALPTWIPGGNPCGTSPWEGVSCNNQGQVTQLSLVNKGLKGPISEAISSLSSLNSLDLGNSMTSNGTWNVITGDLSVLSRLSNLQHLNLTYSYAGSGLRFPTAVLGLTGLITLRLDHARFTGQFPVEISNLKSLQYLYLGNNSMTGLLPKELGNLVHLSELSLWGMNFNSQIPPELQFCQKLTYINLHNSGLWGGLPPEFGNFKFMQNMILYRNSLTGPIPARWKNMNFTSLRLDQNSLYDKFDQWILQHPTLDSVYLGSNLLYGSFPNVTTNLSILSLDCNYLSGPEPSLYNISVPNNCFLSSNPNVDVCSRRFTCEQFQQLTANGTCPPCPDSQTLFDKATCVCHAVATAPSDETKKKTVSAAVIGSSVAAAVAVLLIGLLLILRCRKRRKQLVDDESNPFNSEKPNGSDEYWEPPKGVQRLSFQDLEKATGSFAKDHEIGAGGFGKVFYGDFPDGRTLAIKRCSETGSQGISEFRNEVLLLSRLHHKNLVRLEGFCEDKQILVYEYMRLGNLHNHLFRKEKSHMLDSYKRLDIAVGIARALEYLHTNADPPVIHRDVKPSNVLLDDDLTVKVADFGISRASSQLATHISTNPAGTAGYFDPHYFISHQLSTGSDVYSFGVVLLELVTGQRAVDYTREDINLMAWAKPKLRRDGIAGIVDPCLKDEYSPETFFEMADLALKCTVYEKDARPSMRAILAILEPLLMAMKAPTLLAARGSSSSWEATIGPPQDTSQLLQEWSLISTDSESSGLRRSSPSGPVSGDMVPR